MGHTTYPKIQGNLVLILFQSDNNESSPSANETPEYTDYEDYDGKVPRSESEGNEPDIEGESGDGEFQEQVRSWDILMVLKHKLIQHFNLGLGHQRGRWCQDLR